MVTYNLLFDTKTSVLLKRNFFAAHFMKIISIKYNLILYSSVLIAFINQKLKYCLKISYYITNFYEITISLNPYTVNVFVNYF